MPCARQGCPAIGSTGEPRRGGRTSPIRGAAWRSSSTAATGTTARAATPTCRAPTPTSGLASSSSTRARCPQTPRARSGSLGRLRGLGMRHPRPAPRGHRVDRGGGGHKARVRRTRDLHQTHERDGPQSSAAWDLPRRHEPCSWPSIRGRGEPTVTTFRGSDLYETHERDVDAAAGVGFMHLPQTARVGSLNRGLKESHRGRHGSGICSAGRSATVGAVDPVGFMHLPQIAEPWQPSAAGRAACSANCLRRVGCGSTWRTHTRAGCGQSASQGPPLKMASWQASSGRSTAARSRVSRRCATSRWAYARHDWQPTWPRRSSAGRSGCRGRR